MSILQCIGNTPVTTIDLNPNPNVKLYAKLEGNNPGGSIKDRIALYDRNSRAVKKAYKG